MEYDRVYALIDMDKVISDRQIQAYNRLKSLAEQEAVIVLENNPCFETWLLLHFQHTGRLFGSCNEVTRMLNSADRIPGYGKTQRFQLTTGLYRSLKDRIISHAIPHAQLLEQNREQQDLLYPRAETFRFFEWYFNLDKN